MSDEVDRPTLGAESPKRNPLALIGWPPDPVLDVAGRHAALTASVLVVGLAMIKLVLVTRLQVESALALLVASGPATVVLGVAITLVPTFAAFVGLLLFIVARSLRNEGRASWSLSLVMPLVVVFAVFYTPLLALGLVAFLVVSARSMDWWMRRSGQAEGFPLAKAVDAVLLVLLISALLNDRPWMPPEVIGPRAGEPFVGYVAGVQGPWVVILRNDDRSVVTYRESNIAYRYVCSRSGGLTLSVDQLITARTSDLPRCPDD